MTARRALRDVGAVSFDGLDLRQLATPSYLVFPSTILILHPDYLSVVTATPLAPARALFTHWMLVPELPHTPAEEAHWKKSFELIDEGVFEREDLFAVEAMQRGLATGANESLLFGELEFPAAWFHDALDAMLGAAEA